VIVLLALLTAVAITYTVAGGEAALACAAGCALESANLILTERLGRYLLQPRRNQAGLFRLFYFLKYAALIVCFVLLAITTRRVIALAVGFSVALAVHVATRSMAIRKEALRAA